MRMGEMCVMVGTKRLCLGVRWVVNHLILHAAEVYWLGLSVLFLALDRLKQMAEK
jgi:hypothetical protein